MRGGTPRFNKSYSNAIGTLVNDVFEDLGDAFKERIVEILKEVMKTNYLSNSARTGIIVAGFGGEDKFPTLVAYEIEGMILGRVKVNKIKSCDIDREGERAAVFPFAQKEMVDRFLYGLDEDIQKEITKFARGTVTTIGETVAGQIEFANEQDRVKYQKIVFNAEKEFINGLQKRAFDVIREKSRKAIEDIVEFMPKPEIAKMAEALVELTSIKRRVSRGMETVREPIDVAVISKSEGFVWVKRKHYFPSELNVRYRERVIMGMRNRNKETADATEGK